MTDNNSIPASSDDRDPSRPELPADAPSIGTSGTSAPSQTGAETVSPAERIPAGSAASEAVTTPLAPAAQAPGAQTAPAAPGAKRPRKRTLLLVGGAVAAAAVLLGGGAALGAAIADDDDRDDDIALVADERSANGSGTNDSGTNDSGTNGSGTNGSGTNGSGTNGSAAAAASGTADADELSDIIAAATAAGQGLGDPTGIEATRDGGWEVRFETAAGDETEVLVAADGTVRIVETDAADADDADARRPAGVLDSDTVAALVAAALAQVDGTIVDIDVDEDAASPYDVTVLLADRTTVDIELGADFAVLRTDVDD